MRTIRLTHDYPFAAREVWDVATRYDCLAEVMQNLITFDGLPAGHVEQGQSLTVSVSLFGKLPAQPYFMDVIALDQATMTLSSSERGAGVKTWLHTLQVTPTASGSRLTDTIAIEAGWLTWPFTLWAKFLYKKRHKPRLRILDRKHAAAKT